jgi:hypothetical protein
LQSIHLLCNQWTVWDKNINIIIGTASSFEGEAQLEPCVAGMQHQQHPARRCSALGAAAQRLREGRRCSQPN